MLIYIFSQLHFGISQIYYFETSLKPGIVDDEYD